MGLWDRLKGRGSEHPPQPGSPKGSKDAAAAEWVPRLSREAPLATPAPAPRS